MKHESLTLEELSERIGISEYDLFYDTIISDIPFRVSDDTLYYDNPDYIIKTFYPYVNKK